MEKETRYPRTERHQAARRRLDQPLTWGDLLERIGMAIVFFIALIAVMIIALCFPG